LLFMRSQKLGWGSGFRDPRSRNREPEKTYPGSRGQTSTGSRTRNTGCKTEVGNGSPDDLVPEDDEAQVVDILTVVLLDVHAVHVHENVPDHHHARLVVVPCRVQRLQEVVVQSRQHIIPHLSNKVTLHVQYAMCIPVPVRYRSEVFSFGVPLYVPYHENIEKVLQSSKNYYTCVSIGSKQTYVYSFYLRKLRSQVQISIGDTVLHSSFRSGEELSICFDWIPL
jgi:hypothetical protein